MASEDFVAVACDDWYQRRRRDAEGEFFINVANQGPRKGEGGATRQGIYILTAGGKLLSWKNTGQLPDVTVEMFRDALQKWGRLPESQRAPGAVKVPDHGKLDPDYHRQPPAGGVIIKVYARALDQQARSTKLIGSAFTDAECKIGAGDEASRDHLWLTESEWRSLVPADPKVGARNPLPRKIAERILRFHLVDHTRGEPTFWRRDEIRASDLTLTVKTVTPSEIQLGLEGSARLSADADPEKASRGYEPELEGLIKYDRVRQRLTHFDIVAVGDHWGAGRYTRRARPGRTPLGVAFELAASNSPANSIAPQGAREFNDYFGR